ncbi:MAG TPA: carboxymuconolactone decarboxylase family protein, partial [Patescibacteria group bacterium]|nr:carboxymuconolactone decarboxylase family protein [Patescibacteria group bacterium]
NPAAATGKAKTLLDAVQSRFGMTPNSMRTMASSPAVLDAFLNLSGALAGGMLDAKAREQIALAVAEVNGCGYCLSAHAAVGKLVGLDDDMISQARRVKAANTKTGALLSLAQAITLQRGEISDETFRTARRAGLTDGEIAEVVANVALNIFTNYFNLVARTEIDFPFVKPAIVADDRNADAATA